MNILSPVFQCHLGGAILYILYAMGARSLYIVGYTRYSVCDGVDGYSMYNRGSSLLPT